MDQQITEVQEKEKKEDIEIDIVELLFYYRAKWKGILVLFLLGALVAGIITYYFITPKYTATSKLYVVSASTDSVVDLTDLNLGTSLSSDYEELLKIRPVFEEIIKEESLDVTYEELLEMVGISVIEDTRILVINVQSTDPKEAQKVANALVQKAVTYLPKVMEISAPNIAEKAILPKEPSSPNNSRNVMLGALLGAVLALGVLTIIYVTDDTLRSAEDVEKKIGVMPFTVIPEGDIAKDAADQTEKKTRKKSLWKRRKG